LIASLSVAVASFAATSAIAQTLPTRAECLRLGSDVPGLLKALALDPAQYKAKVKNMGPEQALPAVCYKLDLDTAIAFQNCAKSKKSIGTCEEAEKAQARRASNPYCDCAVRFFSAPPPKLPTAALSPECAAIKDAAVQAECEALRQKTEAMDRQTKALRDETAASEKEVSCTDQVKAGIASGRFTRESLAKILDGRKARDVGACNILAALSKLKE
jgi:hypothetical protein